MVSMTVTKLKYYNPFILVGTILFTIAAGLFTTLKVDTPRPTVVGFQIISGAGCGTALQMVRSPHMKSNCPS